jgi:hypothetical protein
LQVETRNICCYNLGGEGVTGQGATRQDTIEAESKKSKIVLLKLWKRGGGGWGGYKVQLPGGQNGMTIISEKTDIFCFETRERTLVLSEHLRLLRWKKLHASVLVR